MNEYTIYIHRGGSSLICNVDAATDADAKVAGLARWNEVHPTIDPTGGLIEVSYLRTTPVRAPFVILGIVR